MSNYAPPLSVGGVIHLARPKGSKNILPERIKRLAMHAVADYPGGERAYFRMLSTEHVPEFVSLLRSFIPKAVHVDGQVDVGHVLLRSFVRLEDGNTLELAPSQAPQPLALGACTPTIEATHSVNPDSVSMREQRDLTVCTLSEPEAFAEGGPQGGRGAEVAESHALEGNPTSENGSDIIFRGNSGRRTKWKRIEKASDDSGGEGS